MIEATSWAELSKRPIPPRRCVKAEIELARTIPHLRWTRSANDRVHVRGQRLSRPIYWRGRQWAVTRYGLEKRDGTYVIEIDRIWQQEFGDQPWGWVRHMSTKSNIDLDDFVEALRIARTLARIQERGLSLSRPFFARKRLPVCPEQIADWH